MLYKKFNIWYLNSFLISAIVAIPIVTVFSSFFESTGKYSVIIKDTFLFEYFDEYNKDTESVNKVKVHLKRWREIQSYCLQTYKRAMYMENDCYPMDSVEKKRSELNDLGIKS